MAQGIHGRFVWQELTTEDPATAVSFYSKVVGWQAHPNASHPDYTEFGIGGRSSAGMMRLSDDLRAAGVRSHWLPYVGVSDVDSSVASAQQQGGKVLHAAQDLEHVGRFAILADPQGGPFAVIKPAGAGSAPASGAVPAGSFAWLELATSDYEAAFEFYSKLFGWQVIRRMDMGPQGVYLIFGSDGVQRGGIYKMHQERSSKPYWLPYAEVASADSAAAAATAAGGRILVGPMDVPGGRMVQLLDPSGAIFAVHSPAPKATAPKPAPAKRAAAPKPAAPKPAAGTPAASKPATASPTAVPAAKPSAPAAAAPKPSAPKPAVKKKPAAKKKAAAKKKSAARKKAAGKKKPAAKKKAVARKKKAAARKSAAKSARKSSKKKTAKKAAKKAARKGSGKKTPAKGRRKK